MRPARRECLGARGVARIACGDDAMLLVGADGVLYEWSAAMRQPSPVAGLGGGVAVASIGCGGEHCVVATAEGGLFAWGGNDDGQLGRSREEGVRQRRGVDRTRFVGATAGDAEGDRDAERRGEKRTESHRPAGWAGRDWCRRWSCWSCH